MENDIFYGEYPEIGLRRGNMAVEWTNLGEGWSGDYDAEDPEDTNLLRFDTYVLAPTMNSHESPYSKDGREQKVAIEDASYCTRMPADTPEDTLKRGLVALMNEFYTASASINDHPNVKKKGEFMSWLCPEDFD